MAPPPLAELVTSEGFDNDLFKFDASISSGELDAVLQFNTEHNHMFITQHSPASDLSFQQSRRDLQEASPIVDDDPDNIHLAIVPRLRPTVPGQRTAFVLPKSTSTSAQPKHLPTVRNPTSSSSGNPRSNNTTSRHLHKAPQQDMDLSRRSRETPNTVTTFCSLTPDQILSSLGHDGMTLTELTDCFTEQDLPRHEQSRATFLNIVNDVTERRSDARYYPRLFITDQASDVDVPRFEPAHEKQAHNTHNLNSSKPHSAQTIGVPPLKSLLKRDREVSPRIDHTPATPTSLPPAASSSPVHPRDGTSNKKPRVSDLEARKSELLRKLDERKQQKLAARKAFEEKQKDRESEERRHLEAERHRAEEAERRRVELEECERHHEAEMLREIEMLTQQVDKEDTEIQELAKASERFENDWTEQRNLRDVEQFEREMESEDWTIDRIEEMQAKLEGVH